MKLLYIYDGDWPKAAVRVRKETRALSDAGYEVILLSRNEARQPRSQTEPWMQVRRLPTVPGRLANRLFGFPFFFNPVWIWAILTAAIRERPGGILVADLPLAPTALLVGKITRVPVLYDMVEVYPEFLRGLIQFKKRTWADRLIRNPGPALFLEWMALRWASHTFVVSEESKSRALSRGASTARVTVVGNTPENVALLSDPTDCPPGLEEYRDRAQVLFVGILISDRGLIQAVRAMESVKASHPEALLVIVGDGLEEGRIKEEIAALSLQDHVLLAGWRDPSELPGFYQRAKVGLLPFLDGGQIRFTLANKLFDYMGAGLPVVASDVPPMRRILEESGAGILVEPGNVESISAGISSLLSASPAEWEEMGRAGGETVRYRYNWEEDARRFLSAVNSVLLP